MLMGEAAVEQTLRETFVTAWAKTVGRRPFFPVGIKLRRNLFTRELTALLDPLSERVLVVQVLRSSVDHGFGRRKTDALPLETALEAPSENARPLGLELLREVLIPFLGWHRDGEGHE